MRNGILLLTFLVLMAVAGCGERVGPGQKSAATTSGMTSGAASGDEDIVAVLMDAEAGWNRGDIDAFMQSYAPTDELRFVGEDRIQFGWQRIRDNFAKSYPDGDAMGRLAFFDLEVDRLGPDAALVVGRWRLDREEDQPHGVFSLVMRHTADGWRIVSDHTSSSDGTLTAAEASITEGDLLAKVRALTSEEMAGRLPGTPGYRLAAEWAAARFQEMGLEPGGDQGYLQAMAIEANEIIGDPEFAIIGSDKEYTLGEDHIFRGFTGAGDVQAEVVFCGYGISATDRGYDDYAGVDVQGKIVLIFKQPPSWRPEDGEGWGPLAYPRPKALAAAAHGARAVLMVARPNDSRPQPLIGSVFHGEGEHPEDLPQLQISLEAAAELVGGMEELQALQTRIDESQAPASQALGREARVKVETRYQPEAETWNVVGILPGRDPYLSTETLILGAHLDHVGVQADRLVFPGANDNASGSAAILEIAEAFVNSGKRPRRTVAFVLFSGEEQGLVGARHHAENPYQDLDASVAMMNFDCVACGDSIRIGGGKSAPLLWGKTMQLDAGAQNLMVMNTWHGGGADAQPFFDQGLPTLYFVTKNSYDHLHKATDKVQTLNGPLFEAITRLGYRTAAWVAEGGYQREVIQPR